MPDRTYLAPALWFSVALALLASLLVSPIRTSGSHTVSSGSVASQASTLSSLDLTPPYFSTVPVGVVAMSRDKCLSSMGEQEGSEVLDLPRACAFFFACEYRWTCNRALRIPLPNLSHFPLRC